MTTKDYEYPRRALVFGVALVLAGLVLGALADSPTETTRRGLPMWLVVAVPVAAGAYFIVVSTRQILRARRR